MAPHDLDRAAEIVVQLEKGGHDWLRAKAEELGVTLEELAAKLLAEKISDKE